MTKKRFTWDNLGEVDAIADGDTFRWYLMLDGITDLVKFMNEQDQRITELESQLRQCQATKNDNGRFKVWQVPPIKEGTKIGITTTEVND